MIELILAAFASYRIAHMIALEDGPADAFTRFRTFIESRLTQESWIVRGFNCPLCLGFWISLVFAAALRWGQLPLFDVVLVWLGIAGAQTALELLTE